MNIARRAFEGHAMGRDRRVPEVPSLRLPLRAHHL